MSSIASLFDSCSAVVPEFTVVKTRQATQVTDHELTGAERRLKQKADRQEKAKRLELERACDTREKRTVFVGNISLPCTRKVLKQLFKKYGTVETVRLRSLKVKPGDLPNKVALKSQKQLVEGSTCNAYIVMKTEEEAEKSLALNGTQFHGRHLRVDLLGRSKVKAVDVQSNSVFVGNLPFTADEEDLREAFTLCGQVETVRIIRDKKTGSGKGFGFVTFSERSGVMFAVQRSRKIELEGRVLRVFKAKSEEAMKSKKFSGHKVTGHSIKAKLRGKKTKIKKQKRN